MAKHKKEKDYNSVPFDPSRSPAQKAQEFDEQWGQNRKPHSKTPNLDAYEARESKRPSWRKKS